METKTDRIKRDIQELARFNATPGRSYPVFLFTGGQNGESTSRNRWKLPGLRFTRMPQEP